MRVDTCRSTPSAFSGYAPIADSPLSISASARCRTTSAMSATCMITFADSDVVSKNEAPSSKLLQKATTAIDEGTYPPQDHP